MNEEPRRDEQVARIDIHLVVVRRAEKGDVVTHVDGRAKHWGRGGLCGHGLTSNWRRSALFDARFLQNTIGQFFPALRKQLAERRALIGVLRLGGSFLEVRNRLTDAVHVCQESAEVCDGFDILRIERDREEKSSESLLAAATGELRGGAIVGEL